MTLSREPASRRTHDPGTVHASNPGEHGRRRLLGTMAQLCALGLVMAMCAELAARLDDYVRAGVPLRAVPDLTYDLILRDSLASRGRPNGRFQKWQLNSAGFRSPESALIPRLGCVRVMTLGSSETFGAAAESPGKEFPAQLADSLAVSGCYQVLNAAVVGIAVPGMIQLWESWASRFRPDIVVVLANPAFYLGENAPAFPKPHRGPPAMAAPWWTPRLLGRARDVIEVPAFIQRRRVQRQLSQLVSGKQEGWFFRSVPEDRLRGYERDLDSLVQSITARGAQPVVALYPIRFGERPDEAERSLLESWRTFSPRALPQVMLAFAVGAAGTARALAMRRGVPIVDLPRRMNGERSYFVDAVHYTDTGAGIVANEISRVVRQIPPVVRDVAREKPGAAKR